MIRIILLLFSSFAQASDIVKIYGVGGSITVSSITASNIGANQIVTTSGSGLLVGQSTFTLTPGGNFGIGTASPQTAVQMLSPSGSRSIFVNSPSPVLSATSGNTDAEIALFATAYSATAASMLDLLSYSTGSANPLYRISNHWENSGGASSSGTISMGSYVGTTFTDVLNITTGTSQGSASGSVGVMTLTPRSTLDVNGNMAIGTFAATNAAPSNGLIVSGNVGVGVSTPAVALDVSGSSQFGGGANKSTFTVSGALNLASGAALTVTGSNGNIIGSSSFTTTGLLNGAHVTTTLGADFTSGVAGTSVATFTVTGTGSAPILNFQRADSAVAGQLLYDGTNGGFLLGSLTNHFMSMETNGSTRLTILGGGNVGVGTTNPTQKLHVSSGTVLVDGNVSPNFNSSSGTMRLWSRTTAQIDTLAAGAVGEIIFCSNCSTVGICVSTGTAASQWQRAGVTNGCGTGN